MTRQTGRFTSAAALISAITALAASLCAANPVPLPEHWMAGRPIPAEAVPVDLVSEKLVAHISSYRLPEEREPSARLHFARADVSITYTLRSEADVDIPIVFPITEQPEDVVFELNDEAVRAETIADTRMYATCEDRWVAAIEKYIDGDPVLAGLRDEAMAMRDPHPPANQAEADARMQRHLKRHLLIKSRAERRFDELGVPDAQTLGSWLSDYLLDDWHTRVYLVRDIDPDATAEHLRLSATRDLAVAFDANAPDPTALWSGADAGKRRPSAMHQRWFLISAVLRLHAGDNRFIVRYKQPVSFGNAGYELPEGARRPESDVMQASIFEFILRTARFWRSMGGLDVTIHLPRGTVYADCNLPDATISLTGDDPTVTCTTAGVPDANLSVVFADFKVLSDPRDWMAAFRRERPGAPKAVLNAIWDRPLKGEGSHNTVPVADEKIVVTGSNDGFLTVCDRAHGNVIHEIEAGGAVGGVVILPDALLVGLETHSRGWKRELGLARFDRTTGERIWAQSVVSLDHHGHDVRPVDAGPVVLGCAVGGPVLAVDAADGGLLWEKPGAFSGIALSPDGLTAYLAGVTAERLEATPRDARASAALAELMAVDVTTGEVMWRRPCGHSCSAPALWGDKLVVMGRHERLARPFLACVLSADGETLWEMAQPGEVGGFNSIQATMVRGDRLLVMHDKGIDVYDLEHNGKRAARVHYDFYLSIPPAVAGQRAYVPLSLGGMQVFDLDTGEMLHELICARAGCTALVDGDELFTLEWSGLLTKWSPEARPLQPAPAVAETGWSGTPPGDLPEVLRTLTGDGR